MKGLIIIFYIIIGFHVLSQKEDIQYDFSCLETDFITSGVSLFGDLEKKMLHSFGQEVTIEEEISAGKDVYFSLNEKQIIQTHPKLSILENILKTLSEEISNPRGFSYSIYVMDTTELNAFTIGGYIFITTEMLNFCQSNDELACIIGHEIAHNELGHLTDQMSRIKSAKEALGEDVGSWAAYTGQLMILSFNQKNEAHCDAFGADLVELTEYDTCAASSLWKRMSEIEVGQSDLTMLFRSHPYSSDRKKCIENHLMRNYNHSCK